MRNINDKQILLLFHFQNNHEEVATTDSYLYSDLFSCYRTSKHDDSGMKSRDGFSIRPPLVIFFD